MILQTLKSILHIVQYIFFKLSVAGADFNGPNKTQSVAYTKTVQSKPCSQNGGECKHLSKCTRFPTAIQILRSQSSAMWEYSSEKP